ncbi:hypothetical protein DVR12_07520 [Chitinophaga silvatica]|uniref:IraD/Gp25-like domain-containing protein n=1 Tax=Chitinophaga silvatica TaxID=2282649 RepID=A0A3E1YER9_9BACT|nr:GPW/gp25 family protein [Chitinophaga silvatica]RFS25026.1 hypothetical protein DVR12_07520 [Chitinophaga silvatica]
MQTKLYKIPVSFSDILNNKGISTINIRNSIEQNIQLLITTVNGECKFDKLYGCKWWENDFNLKQTILEIKEQLEESVRHSLEIYEKRLNNAVITATILQPEVNQPGKIKVELNISGIITSNNQFLKCRYVFLISPFCQY